MSTESPKLRMEQPERYDFTDNRVGIFQAPQFSAAIKEAYWRGIEDASLPATATFALTLLLVLVPPTNFSNFLNMPGATWRAVFFLLFISASVIFLFLLIRKWLKRKRHPQMSKIVIEHDFFGDIPTLSGDVDGTFNNRSTSKLLLPDQKMNQKSRKYPLKGVRRK